MPLVAREHLRTEYGATSDVLRIVLEQFTREPEQLDDPRVGDRVVDVAMLAPGSDEPAPAQTRKMVRDLRLRLAGGGDQLAHGPLRLRHEPQDPQADRVAEGPEVLRQDVHGRRRSRQVEGDRWRRRRLTVDRRRHSIRLISRGADVWRPRSNRR